MSLESQPGVPDVASSSQERQLAPSLPALVAPSDKLQRSGFKNPQSLISIAMNRQAEWYSKSKEWKAK